MVPMYKRDGLAPGEFNKDSFAKAPVARAGMRIGLLGGSYDPPHEGHLHISLEAIKRLKLDQLWWLVSPGNPLKEQGPLAAGAPFAAMCGAGAASKDQDNGP